MKYKVVRILIQALADFDTLEEAEDFRKDFADMHPHENIVITPEPFKSAPGLGD